MKISARPTIATSRTLRVAAFHRPRSVDLRGVAISSIESQSRDGKKPAHISKFHSKLNQIKREQAKILLGDSPAKYNGRMGRVLQLFPEFDEEFHLESSKIPRNICEVLVGDAMQILRGFPDGLFQTVVTSPPYWGLRDYGVEGQIGAEMDVNAYISNLVAIFREVRRTLAGDGTLWLNIGDSYTSGGRTWRDEDAKNKGRGMSYRAPTPDGLKPKDLIGVPWKAAFALQADGWYLRSDMIWNKPNCQPESVKDRPTRSHEYIFLFSKSERYFYDHESIQEPAEDRLQRRKNRRSVWNINTEPYAGAHFAVYPRPLVRLCVAAGSRKGDRVLDPFFGSGTTGVVCNELERQCTGIEISQEYADLARNRLLKGR